MLGGHGDTMVAMLNHTKINGLPIQKYIDEGKLTQEELDELVERTKRGRG